MILALDAGNSLAKYGIFEGDDLVESGSIEYDELFYMELNSKLKNCAQLVYCSVKDFSIDESDIAISNISISKITIKSEFPIEIDYATPQTLGIDRLVAACSAFQISKKDVLIVDCGTCITYDLVLDNTYVGGAISPGISIRFKALNNFTDKLPLITKFDHNPNAIGSSTMECIESGVVNGVINEIQGFIFDYQDHTDDLDVYLTGGDAFLFEDALKNHIFVDENLVIKGLNILAKLNG